MTTAAVLAGGVLTAAPAQAVTTPTITSKGAYLMNSVTGKDLYKKSADVPRLTASTTKIMTAKVVLSQTNLNLDTKVTIKQAVSDYMVRQGYPSSAKLIVGDKVTVRQLLYGMMLRPAATRRWLSPTSSAPVRRSRPGPRTSSAR